MKSVLITGAARGLGASLASASVEAGFSVIATVRDPGKIDTQLKVRAEALDLADTESLHVLTDQLIKEECVIDLLINNAGMNPKDRSDEYFNSSFRLEHFSAANVTESLHVNALMPMQLVSMLLPVPVEFPRSS